MCVCVCVRTWVRTCVSLCAGTHPPFHHRHLLFYLTSSQLARSTSDSRQAPEELAAPAELSLPQLCLAVSAKELVTGVSGKGRGRSDGSDKAEGAGGAGGTKTAVGGAEEDNGGLFRERQALSYFAVDCRSKQQVGRPTRLACMYIYLCDTETSIL